MNRQNHKLLLTRASKELATNLSTLHKTHKLQNITTYNVLEYAWNSWETYIHRYADINARILLLGINPGPNGMVQTGIPFGNVGTVKNWLKISAKIDAPAILHPKRPVVGLSFHKEEPSGVLLWDTIKKKYREPEDFFKSCFILNYSPLAFFDIDGKNLTPDKLPKEYRQAMELHCTKHVDIYIRTFEISHILAIGRYTFNMASKLIDSLKTNTPIKTEKSHLYENITIHYITHPSPLNPNHKNFPAEFLDCMHAIEHN